MKNDHIQFGKNAWVTRGMGLYFVCLLFVSTVDAQTADLIACTHRTGAVVYTQTPSVLGNQFVCPGNSAKASGAQSPKEERLDPTPNQSRIDSDCPSTAKIKVNSSGYTGRFVVELRMGNRPGSKRISGGSTANGGELSFENVCPGNYFYAFGPTDSDSVSVTRYFEIKNENGRYNNPEITVFFSRTSSDGSNRVQQAKKRDL